MRRAQARFSPLVLALTLGALAGARPAEGTLVYTQTQSGSVVFGDSTPVVLMFTGAPAAASDATLSLVANGGELANNGKRLEQLLVDGVTYQTPGWDPGFLLPVNYLDQFADPVAPVTIPLADLAGHVLDGQVEVSVVRPNFLAGGVFDVVLSYTAVPEPAAWLLFAPMLGALATRRGNRGLTPRG